MSFSCQILSSFNFNLSLEYNPHAQLRQAKKQQDQKGLEQGPSVHQNVDIAMRLKEPPPLKF
jgi:hypothetical protein